MLPYSLSSDSEIVLQNQWVKVIRNRYYSMSRPSPSWTCTSSLRHSPARPCHYFPRTWSAFPCSCSFRTSPTCPCTCSPRPSPTCPCTYSPRPSPIWPLYLLPQTISFPTMFMYMFPLNLTSEACLCPFQLNSLCLWKLGADVMFGPLNPVDTSNLLTMELSGSHQQHRFLTL